MQYETCPHEIEVLAARRSREWNVPLKTHLEACPRCREAIRIASWMSTLAADSPQHRALPDPDLLWIKSNLFGRQEASDRAMQPLVLGDMLARAVVGAFAAAWLALNWPSMQAYLGGLWSDAGLAMSVQQAGTNPWPLTLASLIIAGALAAIVLVLRPLMTRN